MDILRPKNRLKGISIELLLGGGLILLVVLTSVLAGRCFNESQLGNWGSWIGAFMAGIAMAATSYAIILQARHGESASWAIALSRLGDLYDQAYQDEVLAKFLAEPSDSAFQMDPNHCAIHLTDRQKVWLGSLGLAFEQIYVATNALSSESKRVWRLYLRNQLNKPTLRAAFVADASNSKDYHQDFWRFIRGTNRSGSGDGYINYAIHPKYFKANGREKPDRAILKKILSYKPATENDLEFWMEIYHDPIVRNQMYAVPLNDKGSFWQYLSAKNVHTVWEGTQRIGGFTLVELDKSLASFGIVLHSQYRNKGYGKGLMDCLQSCASEMGYRTLRADVFDDNKDCLDLLSSTGFRRFVWLEKNI